TDQWITRALCRELDPDTLFVSGAAQNTAKLVCRGSPVRIECLTDALEHRVEFGVWGGMTERERRALLRKHPEVDDWGDLLERAERQGEDPARYAAAPYCSGWTPVRHGPEHRSHRDPEHFDVSPPWSRCESPTALTPFRRPYPRRRAPPRLDGPRSDA